MSPERMGSLYRAEILRLLKKDLPHGRVLDVGCYDGHFLSQLNAGLQIGVDLHPPKTILNVPICAANAEDLPFADNSFDYIYSLDVIEHVEDDNAYADSLLRVLAPGGMIILTTPAEDIKVFPAFLTNWVSKKWGHHKFNGYSKNKIIDLFDEDNTNIKITALSARGYLNWYLILRLGQIVSSRFVEILLKRIAKEDYSRIGPNGFLLIEVKKKF